MKDRNDRREELAREFKERLDKAFGSKLRGNPDVAAMALESYFDKELLKVLWEMKMRGSIRWKPFWPER